jgi:hypothetical protein
MNSKMDDKKPKQFVKRQNKYLNLMKSFRKSRDTTRAWVRNPTKYLWAIRKWHHSAAGRKAHRKLNRFLITHTRNPLAIRQEENVKFLEQLRQLLLEEVKLNPSLELEELINGAENIGTAILTARAGAVKSTFYKADSSSINVSNLSRSTKSTLYMDGNKPSYNRSSSNKSKSTWSNKTYEKTWIK